MEFTALHRALGLSAGPLVDRLINDAVAAQLAETDDLDFKRKLPAAKELATSDYPKDVAAMANSGGGTIVFGVAETNKLASGRVDVGEVDENYQRTLVRVPVASIHPPVFGVKVYPLGDPSMRAAVVVVPASIDGPHLIYRGECFGAPVRNDADTEWMKERQIEAMYRARFDERRHIAERLTTLYDELAQARDTTERAWLIAVAHPRIPAQTSERIDRQYARDLFDKAADQSLVYAGRNQGTHIFETIDRHNPRPGLRRWIAPTTTDRARWGEAQASIHHDGSYRSRPLWAVTAAIPTARHGRARWSIPTISNA
ncbi:AlbA family DNA-binding domain-containing protein [Nocardia takedensis]|uniref:AlbA family DNA-binding domain-containing protein n=1 Tax=Nocardia takedensis TaxID=259390 RepID=UPI003F770878